MFHIPIRPGEYSTLDEFDGLVDDHPSPVFPPVSAGKAALAKELHAQVRQEEREERRAELRMTLCVAAFMIAVLVFVQVGLGVALWRWVRS